MMHGVASSVWEGLTYIVGGQSWPLDQPQICFSLSKLIKTFSLSLFSCAKLA